MNTIRKKKIESEIVKSVANLIISGKVKDPRIEMVSVHRANISDDFSVAKIWVTSYCDEKGKKKLLQGLKNASGFIQSVVSRDLRLRITPKFNFYWDEEYIKAFEVNQLIDSLPRLEEN